MMTGWPSNGRITSAFTRVFDALLPAHDLLDTLLTSAYPRQPCVLTRHQGNGHGR